jgi:hypothetical protein
MHCRGKIDGNIRFIIERDIGTLARDDSANARGADIAAAACLPVVRIPQCSKRHILCLLEDFVDIDWLDLSQNTFVHRLDNRVDLNRCVELGRSFGCEANVD